MIYNLIKGIGSWGSDTLTAKMALGMSILTIALVLSMQNTPCISASSCVVGDSETFSGTLKINSGNNFGHTLSGTATTDRILTMPDVSGELLVGNFTGNANKIMQVNTGANAVEYGFVDPLTQIDITSGGTQTPLAGQLLQVNTGANALTFGNVGIANINDSGVAGQFLKSSGSALSFSKIDITDSTQIDIGTGTSGQILSVNQSGTALEYGPLPASAGSFQATAAQNVVAGTVGIEANGQVRNITTLQNGVTQLTLSQTSTGYSQSNVTWLSSHYNSNVDAQIFVYRDYDANNQNTCDTHYYVDVVQQNVSGTLSNWGRQCISDEWQQHQTNGYTQYNASQYPQGYDHCYKFNKYGLEEDYSTNNYVFVYAGCAGNNSNSSDGQIWSVPIQINASNNTLIVGTETLLHDQHVCNNNDACNNTNQAYYPTTIHSNVYAKQTSDANRMWIFYRAYQGGYYSNSYVWYKSYTCNFTQSTGDTCTPNQAYSSDMYQGNGSNSLIQNWYDTFSPAIWWDDNAQAFLVVNRTTMSNSQCRFAQMRLAENYNSANTSFSTTLNYVMGYTGVTDDINGGTFDVSGSSISCGRQNQRPIFDVENNQFIWLFGSGSTNDIDTVLYHMKGDTNSYTGTPIEVGLGSLQGLITDEECANTLDRYCNSVVQNLEGHVYIDNTVSPYKFYWHNIGLMDRNICTKDYQSSKCSEIYTWSMNNTTGFIDNTTFTHFDYQNQFESYHNAPDLGFGVWLDQSTETLFTFNAHGNTAIDPANNNKLHAVAFVIPDNVSTWIGYATQGGNQGASITVYSIGAVIDGLNGLTIGTEYYVKDDGSLGTSGTYKIGRAIATDKIYITNAR